MSNLNLTAALQGSLNLLTNSTGESETISPLSEATPDSIDLFLSRINEDLAAGLPERITDARLSYLVTLYRAEALKWEQQEAQPKTRAAPGSKNKISPKMLLNIQI